MYFVTFDETMQLLLIAVYLYSVSELLRVSQVPQN